jgi:hypothetical protein
MLDGLYGSSGIFCVDEDQLLITKDTKESSRRKASRRKGSRKQSAEDNTAGYVRLLA